MAKGVRGSGTPKVSKVRRPRKKVAGSDEVVTKSPQQSVFGAHSIIFDRMISGAKLAEIVEKDLNTLAKNLVAFDTQFHHDFGKRVLEKITKASVDALVSLKITDITMAAKHETNSPIEQNGDSDKPLGPNPGRHRHSLANELTAGSGKEDS
jgi:phosphatidate phosphatase PAH1